MINSKTVLTANIYVSDIINYLGQNPFVDFDKVLSSRIDFWMNGATRKRTRKSELMLLLDRSPVEKFDEILVSAKKIMNLYSFEKFKTMVNISRGKKMEEKCDNIGIREFLIREPIITIDNIEYQWSVRCDGIQHGLITEIKTRNKPCPTIIYPNEKTQIQIYMGLTNTKCTNFVEFSNSKINGMIKRELIVKYDWKAFKLIKQQTKKMIREKIHPKLSEVFNLKQK